MADICFMGAFLGGLFSFLSPCVLPLIPSYVSFITGISFDDFKGGDKAHIRKTTIISSLSFIAGFSLVFILLGVFSSFVGRILIAYYDEIRIIGGTIIILLGLYVMGVFKIRFLSMEKRIHLKSKPRGFIGSFIVGLTFAAGWTPCIGPILGSILFIAGSSGSAFYGFKLLVIYSAGLGIPFFLTSLLINTFLSHFSAIKKFIRPVMILSGLLLITFGVLFLTDSLTFLVTLAPESLEFQPG
ncbi:MAG TPA: cytochrome c biogenesis protein CcdA, partial [Nitrospirae bacterium]|nr:cytochrome c biogenesis protein CcdA [Nitrospirota bacterium]